MTTSIGRALCTLSEVELLAPAARPRVVRIEFRDNHSVVRLETDKGESHTFDIGEELFSTHLLQFLDAAGELPTAVSPVPVAPTLDESWALLHYDIGTTWSALSECAPPAGLMSIERRDDLALLELVGEARTLVQQLPLSGRQLEGACVDLMMAWNRG